MSDSKHEKDSSGGDDTTASASHQAVAMPVGNCPPRAAWPMFVTAAVWFGWIAFLAYLAFGISGRG